MDPDGRLGVVQTGARYAFGFGPSFYGIWDEHAAGGQPVERFPATAEGKQLGWRRFVELEPGVAPQVPGTVTAEAPPERRSNARRWIIVGLVIVVAIVAIVVVRSGKGNKSASGGGGGAGTGNNTAHVVVSGDLSATFDLQLKTVSIVGLNTLIPLADATWQDSTGQQLVFHMDGVKEGANPVIQTAGESLTLHMIQGSETFDFRGQHGECTINVTTLNETNISGTYTCENLQTDSLDKTISVSGTFDGSK